MQTLEQVKKQYVLDVLDECNWNETKACKVLGINRRTMYRWLREWGVKK